MKLIPVLAMTVIALAEAASASGPVIITISTTDAGVSYAMRDPNWRVERSFKSAEELEAWMRENYAPEKEDGGGIWLRPDDRTSFNTVFNVLARFKGVKFKLMLLEGKVGKERAVASWPLDGFLVKTLEEGVPAK